MQRDFSITPGVAWSLPFIGLVDQANTKLFLVDPTIAAGDIKFSVSGGAFTNPTTTPTVSPAGSPQILLSLSAAETGAMTVGQTVTWWAKDAVGNQWCSLGLTVAVAAALNNVAATDIVSSGAIETSAGAVAHVTLTDTTTVAGNMRGTDGANTVAPDNTTIAAIDATAHCCPAAKGDIPTRNRHYC